MATVAGVRFKKAGKVYFFDPSNVWPQPGDAVIVETARGLEIGETVTGAREVGDDQIVQPLKKIMRVATDEDVAHQAYCEQREKDAFEVCLGKIEKLKLEMKLVEVEHAFDNSKIIFYFTANGRVDFRELVKELAPVFKTRIEMRQIGVRDEARMLGGLGSCGRELCCAAFLGDFQPVSIKMAKEQNLSLNPAKISGQCGRLMCCLNYEQENYEKTRKKLPKIGRDIMTPDGIGTVVEVLVIREKVKVRMRQNDDTYDVCEYRIDEVCAPGGTLPQSAPAKDDPDAPLAPAFAKGGVMAETPEVPPAAPQNAEPEPPAPEAEPAPDAPAIEKTEADDAMSSKRRRSRSRSRRKKPPTEGGETPTEGGEAPAEEARTEEPAAEPHGLEIDPTDDTI